ncbi:calcium-binding protein [Shinella kummerowiae]|uniref:calcium-binding protein n=1 Tax=Shinella kummerowiae TaxID=417745 RepID=UPI0021B5B291|nr:hypothetical protein [Shinella kummerowiae]
MGQSFILNSSNNIFTGTDDADTFTGVGGGLDFLRGGGGADLFTVDELQMGLLDGGTGTDTVVLNSDENRIGTDLTFANVEILSVQAPKVYATITQIAAFSKIEIDPSGLDHFEIHLEGGGYGTIDFSIRYVSSTPLSVFTDSSAGLYGTARDDEFNGSAFNDTLSGGNGNDRLDGNEGDDSLIGGLGDDWLGGEDGIDTVSYGYVMAAVSVDLAAGTATGQGTDTLVSIENIEGSHRNDNLLGSDGDNLILGASGDDVIDGRDGVDTLRGDIGNDMISGGAGNDTLNGGSGSDNLNGGSGNDKLEGASGSDQMDGGSGDDIFYVDDIGDTVIEVADGGSDTVYARANARFRDCILSPTAHVEKLSTSSATDTQIINLTGNAFKQYITGNAGANILSDGGQGAADTLRGLAGNDIYRIYNSGDVIIEAADQGTDRITAAVDYALGTAVSVEILATNGSTGTSSIDLSGNELSQSITGNAGANILNGKGGADRLTGLGGADIFAFTTALGGGNVDTITDFNVISDTVRLENAVFKSLLITGELSSGDFRSNDTGLAEDANDHIIFEKDTGELYYDADGTGAASGILFARVTAGLSLAHADFFVI